MTTIEALSFAAQVQVGSKIEMGFNSILEVTEVRKSCFYGKIYIGGKMRSESVSLSFETLLNPHYNKNIKILA